MALQLYLIRHGETEWSLTGQHTGHTDISLTANGMQEARELGTHLLGLTFSHVLMSPLHRAQQTCELVGLSGVPQIEPDLVEWNYGDYEGRKSVDIRLERPNWDVFEDGCPHGERPSQILTRVDRLIARLGSLDGNVALFSHAQIGGVLGVRWIGLPLAEARHFPLGTASVSILSHDPHHPNVTVIALWNFISRPISQASPSSPLSPTLTINQRALQRWENEGGEIPTV